MEFHSQYYWNLGLTLRGGFPHFLFAFRRLPGVQKEESFESQQNFSLVLSEANWSLVFRVLSPFSFLGSEWRTSIYFCIFLFVFFPGHLKYVVRFKCFSLSDLFTTFSLFEYISSFLSCVFLYFRFLFVHFSQVNYVFFVFVTRVSGVSLFLFFMRVT